MTFLIFRVFDMRLLASALIITVLSACGGGGGDSPVVPPPPIIAGHVTSTVTGGTSCVNVVNLDAQFGNPLNWALPINQPSWACNVVDSSNGYPVAGGTQSTRFENRPGDCPSASTGWSDCANDRSRNELEEPTSVGVSNGQTITYSYKIYIPRQERFRPAGNSNLLVLTQMRYSTRTGDNPAGALAYLFAMPGDKIGIRVHDGWSWNSVGDVAANIESIYDRWITVKWEIKATDQGDGYLKVWLDEVLVTQALNRATLPVSDGVIRIKYGIYNSFKSSATEEYKNQVIYFDDFVKQSKFDNKSPS
jgi:hypothetical protein